MNGSIFSSSNDNPDHSSGTGSGSSNIPSTTDITHALQVIHDSRSDNLTRQKASEYLEAQKTSRWAAQQGYGLASEKSQPAVVRHYGLSLLEHTIRHNWHHFDDAQISGLRAWVISLGQSVGDQDASYIRNKIAQLFVELAKKDWAVSWFDLDASLLAFWDQDLIHRELVLTVLEALSEDVFVQDDSAAGVRGQDLHNAVVEIFTHASTFAGGQNKSKRSVRVGSDGWLSRLSYFLVLASQPQSNLGDTRTCVCKALTCMRSAFSWVMGPAILAAQCVEGIFASLRASDADVSRVRMHHVSNEGIQFVTYRLRCALFVL
jgi:exportin-5